MKNCKKPTVVDADGLNIASQSEVLKKYLSGRIITPHVKEASRLTGVSADIINQDREGSIVRMREMTSAVCVLKGSGTLVYDGGESMYKNVSGNNGMSTAGSGDVLAGVIGAILAAKKNIDDSLFESATLGVYLHGLAGERLSETYSEYGVLASELPAMAAKILCELFKK